MELVWQSHLPLPLGEVPPKGAEGALSHGQGRASSPRGGAKKSLNSNLTNHKNWENAPGVPQGVHFI